MEATFDGELIYWRGPSPWHFVRVPDAVADAIHAEAAELTYGWGCIPASVRTGDTTWTTSLFPKDGSYLVPVKFAVLRAEELDLGDMVRLTLRIGPTTR
ncbi:conserved hypothetical protein [Nostocoides japonicum T1-X7]|uniref:DUF1905 domain-containing protein n=1 Tax=Nostocoides japonicum T1-X7 TaxID=1194083 RepID=A0A077LTA3_9MICO|nr:DUF1905 domain-containing protein [Tetrasphaera japonica]CCH76336.1 conserved hypothetical protein [Tetrasphaera japonica T1-X7]